MAVDLGTKSGMQLLADGLHSSLGANVCWGSIVLCHADPLHWPLLALLAFTSIKEYWWDIKYETSDTSGGYRGGFRDQAGWIIGYAVAYALTLLFRL